MGLLDFAGQLFSSEAKAPTEVYVDRIDQCKVIWYQWENELGTSDLSLGPIYPPVPTSALAKSRSYDISNHVETFTFNKTMNEAAGSFSITLANSFDWARWMRPGQWICVYLSGEGDLPLPVEPGQGGDNSKSLGIPKFIGPLIKALGIGQLKPVAELPLPIGPNGEILESIKGKVRCMGVIQRVGMRSSTNGDGTVEMTFNVTGKDFGAILEETELWFNGSHADGAAFEAVVHSVAKNFTRNLTELLSAWYEIFLSPSSRLAKNLTSIKTFFPVQWVLPDQLVKDLSLKMNPEGDGTFGDLLEVQEFHATIFEEANPLPLSGLQGHCWEKLKSLSQPGFHELFTEMSDTGYPKVIFRPIPWARNKGKYPKIGNTMMYYKDLASTSGKLPILPLGTNIASKYLSLDSLTDAIKKFAGVKDLPKDARVSHAVPVSAIDIESFDLGPDYHSRANLFLVDASQNAFSQQNSFALLAKDASTPWPLRDEADIQRHGFRPKFLTMNTFTMTNKQFFGTNPDLDFMKEVNFIQKDFWSDAEDYYSGTLVLAAGKNSVKLGKVAVTDATVKGIAEMVFYIEGYSDSFAVNGDGTCSWTQTLNVTRGVQKSVLDGGSSKDKAKTDPSSFHADRNEKKNEGKLGQIKDAISDPTSLFK